MKTPESEIRLRLEKLRAEMRRQKMSALYLNKTEDVFYFSGFTGSESALLLTVKKQWLLTDFRYREEAEHSAPLFETLLCKGAPPVFAGELAKKNQAKTLGYSTALSVATLAGLRKGARGVKPVVADGMTEKLRAVKSQWEIKRILAALCCAEESFLAFRKKIKAGMTEAELALALEWEMRQRGAEGVAFELIVAVDANASRPHAHADKRKLKKGGLLLVDFGARLGRYNSDLTRVLFLDSIPKFWQSPYELVLAAQAAGIAKIASGRPGKEADDAAREVFAAEKCEKLFGHSLGHGVGLEVHESPRLSKKSVEPLQPGMVVTVEPGLYFPGKGGIRIEDMALVTETGAKILSQLPKNLASAVI